MTAIRDVTKEDLPQILQINNTAVPNVNALEMQALEWFHQHACYFRVALADNQLASFLIALDASAHYTSENYRWFTARYDRFVYIDRVVVAERFRGLGIGRVFYADVQSFAEQRAPLLTCEVNLEPRNEVSLLFHSTRGFHEVGQQTTSSGQQVSLLAKDLPSFTFVREHYRS